VASSEPAPPFDKPKSGPSNALLRILSALVLAPLAIAVAWFGGVPFAAFWGVAALGVWWEWSTLIAVSAWRLVVLTGAGVLALAFALAVAGRYLAAAVVVLLGAIGANIVAPAGRGIWLGGGIVYAGVLLLAPILIRHQALWGFVAIVFVFGVVWATDILAYFVGRLVGGPKLWPKVSPNKTWAGAVGGVLGAVAVGWIVASFAVAGEALHLALVAFGLSIASQAGDLFESAVKRRFGAKDAGHIIPGHGGLMDRLDGFIVAAAIAAVYGICRAGMDDAAQGLLRW